MGNEGEDDHWIIYWKVWLGTYHLNQEKNGFSPWQVSERWFTKFSLPLKVSCFKLMKTFATKLIFIWATPLGLTVSRSKVKQRSVPTSIPRNEIDHLRENNYQLWIICVRLSILFHIIYSERSISNWTAPFFSKESSLN